MAISIIPSVDQYAKVTVDRSRWKFDEDGFSLANNAALLAAQQEMQEKANSIFNDIVTTYKPYAYGLTHDGVPVDVPPSDTWVKIMTVP